jgi:hypothetical protein
MAWIEQRRRADGGVTARVFWRPSGCRYAPRDWETFSAGSDAQNLARADGFKRMVEAAGQRWPDGWVKGEGFVRPPDVADPMTPPPRLRRDWRGVCPSDRRPVAGAAEAVPRSTAGGGAHAGARLIGVRGSGHRNRVSWPDGAPGRYLRERRPAVPHQRARGAAPCHTSRPCWMPTQRILATLIDRSWLTVSMPASPAAKPVRRVGRLPQRGHGCRADEVHPDQPGLRRHLHHDRHGAVPAHRLRRQHHHSPPGGLPCRLRKLRHRMRSPRRHA